MMWKRVMALVFVVGSLGAARPAHAGCPTPSIAGSAPRYDDDVAFDQALLRAGFPADALETMRCIAEFESSRMPGAECQDVDGTTLAIGLFQIYHSNFDELGGVENVGDVEAQKSYLRDPSHNIAAARQIYLWGRDIKSAVETEKTLPDAAGNPGAYWNPYKLWDVYGKEGQCHGLDARLPASFP
jgi:hypothetical protein